MTKKLLIAFVALIIAISSLFSCKLFKEDDQDGSTDAGTNGDTNNDTDTTLPDATPTATLWSIGESVNIIAEAGASEDVLNELFDVISDSIDTIPVFRPTDHELTTHELLIGNTGREISEKAYAKLERIEPTDKYDTRWLIYREGETLAIVYDEDDSAVALTYALEYFKANCVGEGGISAKEGTVASDMFDLKEHYQAIDDKETEKKWAELDAVAGSEITNAIKDLYGMYSDDMILWMADLYDPAIGGFYYSNSARDTVGYLPDGDSTYQVLALLRGSGAFTDMEQVPEEIRTQIVKWIKGLQNANGYFYHPQWGVALTDIRTSRRSRDLARCVSVLRMFGANPTYDTPTGDKGDGILADGTPVSARLLTSPIGAGAVVAVSKVVAAESSSVAVPAHLVDKESFEKYLAKYDLNADSYTVGSGLVAQISEIIYRDRVLREELGADYSLCEILLNWFDERQYENGLWEKEVTENSINGLMKIAGCYSNIGSPMPRAEIAAEGAIKYILNGDVTGGIVGVFNPWSALSRIQSSLRSSKDRADYDAAERIKARVREEAAEAIRKTMRKLVEFQKPGGSYSYLKNSSASSSQGVPIAVAGSYEGDINAALLGSNDVVNSIYSALGFSDHFVPFYTYTDMKVFAWRLLELDAVIKDENIVGEAETVTFDSDTTNAPPVSVDYSASSTMGIIQVIEDPRQNSNGKVLYFNSGNDGKDIVTIPSAQLTSAPTRYVFEADFCIESLSGYSVQIFLDNSYMITFRTKSGKINIVEASSNSEAYAAVQQLKLNPSFGEWFNLRVEYYVGEHDTVRIMVYYNDVLAAVTDNYYDQAGGKLTATGTPAVGYSLVKMQTLSSATATLMMDNIEVYADSVEYKAVTDPAKSPAINVDKEDKPIDTDTETVYTFGTPEYNGILHDFLGKSTATPGSTVIENGVLKLTSVNGKDGFAIKGGSGIDEYVIGTTYYIETDFTYNGGTQLSNDKNAAFIGLLANDDEIKNSKMFAWGYLAFVNGGEAVTLYGKKLEKGVTYRLRIEYTVGNGDYDAGSNSSKTEYLTSCFKFYVNGALVDTSTQMTIGLATPGSDRTFLGFGIYTRGDSNIIDSLEISMDNITIGSKAPTEGGGTGPVLPEEDFSFIDQPTYDGIIPDGWVN